MLFDDYEVLDDEAVKNHSRYYKIRCRICGHVKSCSINNLRIQDNHHSALNCKSDYYQAFIGSTYGDYNCVSYTLTDNHGFLLNLICNVCGHRTSVPRCELREFHHNAAQCKDEYYTSMVGRVFGDQRILAVDGHSGTAVTYLCECTVCHTRSKRTERALTKGVRHGAECFKQIPNSPIKNAIAQRWSSMNSRCNNPDSDSYQYYGARGIKLHYAHAIDLYLDFADELAEHSKIFGLRNSTFDRIDVNGDYTKENLRIATQTIQSTNTTRQRYFLIKNGDQLVLSNNAMECGRVLGVSGRSLGNVIRGNSKSCGGWTLVEVYPYDCDIDSISENKGVTTKVIVGQSKRYPV